MKVLAFTQIFPSSREPTLGPYNYQRIRAVSQFCETRVVSPRPWWTSVRTPMALWRAPREMFGGLAVEYPVYWSVPGQPALHPKLMEASLRRRIARMRRGFAFDAILSFWGCPDSVAAAGLASRFGVPLVAVMLGSDANELARDPRLRPLMREALGQAYRVVAVSRALRERILELGIPAERVVVQHNAVDGARFRIQNRDEARRRLGLPLDRRLVCWVGRLSQEKGVDLLIDAMAQVVREGSNDIDLLLIGGGPLEEPLKAQAARLGLSNRIQFAGPRPPEQIPDWVAACDALCLPSRREGCPNVVLEALASGRPVVAARVGGVPELISEAEGEIVEPESADSLAAGILRALRRDWNPEALRDAVEFLSWEAVGQRLFSLLQDAAGSEQRPQAFETEACAG